MINWLPGAKNAHQQEATQDPLAVIADSENSYHVKRVNPLYKEDSLHIEERPPSPSPTGQESPRKSVSSGYESRGNSSSDSGSYQEFPTKPKREKRPKPERKKRDDCSSKRRNHDPSSHLSPIPEGQVDSIPSPIWPRCNACRLPLQRVHNGTTDPKNFIHKYSECFPSNFRIQLRQEYEHNWEECLREQLARACRNSGSSCGSTLEKSSQGSNRSPDISHVILRDLAKFLSDLDKGSLTAEEILQAVSESIQKSLSSPAVRGEFLLCARDDSSSSSSGYKEIYGSSCSSGGSIAERFRRSQQDEVYHGDVEKSSEGEDSSKDKFVHHRDHSSSSIDSTISPSHTNEVIYGVPLRGAKTEVNLEGRSAECGSKAFERLISAKRKVSDSVREEDSPVISPSGAKAVIVQKIEHPYYVAMGRPDFTLDVPQAERMMSKIASAKRQRCWCRMTTSMLALVFFLVSVIVVSLVITKGRRTFGAL